MVLKGHWHLNFLPEFHFEFSIISSWRTHQLQCWELLHPGLDVGQEDVQILLSNSFFDLHYAQGFFWWNPLYWLLFWRYKEISGVYEAQRLDTHAYFYRAMADIRKPSHRASNLNSKYLTLLYRTDFSKVEEPYKWGFHIYQLISVFPIYQLYRQTQNPQFYISCFSPIH